MVIENVHRPSTTQQHIQKDKNEVEKKIPNEWTANYSYYETFTNRVFDIFNTNHIHPKDLNACCNTIVKGSYIKIIDFDRYDMSITNHTLLLEKNNDKREQYLNQIQMEINKQHY